MATGLKDRPIICKRCGASMHKTLNKDVKGQQVWVCNDPDCGYVERR